MSLRIPFDYEKKKQYSVRNMSVDKRMSIKPGTLIPIYFKKLYPGDKFDIDVSTLLQSNPLITPLMGEFVLRLSSFVQYDSNLYGWYDNNSKLSTNELLHKRRHFISGNNLPYYWKGETTAGAYNTVFRGSFFDFMGIPPLSGFPRYSGSSIDDKYRLCADRVLTYLDIIRNYFVASQTINIPYFEQTSSASFALRYLSKDELDRYFIWLRNQPDGVNIFDLTTVSSASNYFPGILSYFNSMKNGGLFSAQYEPDMLRNILLDIDSTKINVDVINNSFSIDTLRFQNKLQRLVDRYDISGGRFSSWLKTVWGSSANRRLDIPQFVGTTSFIIDPNTVTSVADTSSTPEQSNLGQLGGNINQANYRGKNSRNNTHHYVSVDEPATLCIVASLVPKVDYSQGLERELRETIHSDDYKPEFSQLGFQDVPWSDYSLFPNLNADGQLVQITSGTAGTGTYLYEPDSVVGKQIAWMHLMSDLNRVHGEFAEDGYYSTWVLRRTFTKITAYTDSEYRRPKTTEQSNNFYYVNPFDWYYPFEITDGTLDNFFLQVGLNIRAVRPIGKRFMPTLE